jgi:hypothetical protein
VRQNLPEAKATPPHGSVFRKSPPQVAPRIEQQAIPSIAPALAPPRVTRAAREAMIRRRVLWGGGALAIVLILLGLARTISMWVVLAPLGVICLGVMGFSLVRALQNRGLPYLPKTRRVHSLLVVLVTPILFGLAFAVVPKTYQEQQRLEQMEREDARRAAEKERRDQAHNACQLYVLEHLQAPSSASFSHSAAIVPSEDGGYLIRGSVDAQNAFGAKLRRNYLCAVDSAGRVVGGGVLE